MTGVRASATARGCSSAIAAVAAIGMLIFCALRLRVNNDITHFLPAGTDHRLADLSRQLADSSLTRTLILDVGGADPPGRQDRRRRAGGAAGGAPRGGLAGARADPGARRVGVQAVRATPPLLRLGPARDGGPGPALRRRAGPGRARSQAADVVADGVDVLAPGAVAIPSRWFPAILRRFERARAGSLEVDGDQFVTPDHRHAIIFVGSRHSAFDGSAQRPAARRDPARVRRREPTGGRRPGAAAGGRRADRRRRRAADARRPDPDLRAVDRRRAAGADPACSASPRNILWLPARRRRRARRDHGRRCCCSGGARHDAGDRLDADRRRDRLPDPAC